MANYQQLKAAIDQVIKANGQKEITGPVLNDTLKAIVNSLGAGYQFMGVATPSTNPGTPDQNVFYIAGEAGTYTNFNSIVLPNGVSVLKWNGSWSSETVVGGDGVFDISAYKATGGTLATFADLSAALDGGNNIPSALRKGGMSVKFIQGSAPSSDNKYVQYRLMADSFSTTESDWQGVDDEPTAGSDNLVKSGGVATQLNYLGTSLQFKMGVLVLSGGVINIYSSTTVMYLVVPSYGATYTLKDGYTINNEILEKANGSASNVYTDKNYYIMEDGDKLYIAVRHTDNSAISPSENPFSSFVYGVDFKSKVTKDIIASGLNVEKGQNYLSQGSYYISSGNIAEAYLATRQRVSFTKDVGFNLKVGYKLYGAIIKRTGGTVENLPLSNVYHVNTGEILYLTFSAIDESTQIPIDGEQIVDCWYFGSYASLLIAKKNTEPLIPIVAQNTTDITDIKKSIGENAVEVAFSLGNPYISSGDIAIPASTVRMYAILSDSFIYKLKSDYKITRFIRKTASSNRYDDVLNYIILATNEQEYVVIERVDGATISVTDNPFDYIYINIKAEVTDISESLNELSNTVSCINGNDIIFRQGGYYISGGQIAETSVATRQSFILDKSCQFTLTSGIKTYGVIKLKTEDSVENVTINDESIYKINDGEKLYISFSADDPTQDIYVSDIKPITQLRQELSFEAAENTANIVKLNQGLLGKVDKNQGSVNYGKVLGIDESGEVTPMDVSQEGTVIGAVKFQHQRKQFLGADLISGSSVTLGTGWSGDFANGFVHTSGNAEPLTIQYATTSGKKYLVEMTLSNPSENSVYVSIGNSPSVDVYNGSQNVKVGFISEGGNLVITPSRGYNGTITTLTMKEIVEEAVSVSSVEYECNDVNHGQFLDSITGFWNVGIGTMNTLSSVQNGSRNIGIGNAALTAFKTGTRNIGIGTFALNKLKTGDHNIAIGADSLWQLTEAYDNIVLGFNAMGQQSSTLFAARNVVLGRAALGGVIGGGVNGNYCTDNIAIGDQAGTIKTKQAANKCISIGTEAGSYAILGSVSIGHNAGKVTEGEYNTLIGYEAGAVSAATTINNSIAIGKNAVVTKSNQVVIGNSDSSEFVFGNKKIVFNNDNSVTWETI